MATFLLVATETHLRSENLQHVFPVPLLKSLHTPYLDPHGCHAQLVKLGDLSDGVVRDEPSRSSALVSH